MRNEEKLVYFCQKGDAEKVNYVLLSNHLLLGPPSNYGAQSLMSAIEGGYIEIVQKLLKYTEIDVNCYDSGFNALGLATYYGYKGIVQELLNHERINPNLLIHDQDGDCDNYTPLHIACTNYNVGIVDLMMNYRAVNVNEPEGSSYAETPLTHAVYHSYKLMSPRNQSDINREALARDSLNVVKSLLSNHNIDPNKSNADGWSPLHFSISEQNYEILQELLKHHDIDPNQINPEGKTPLIQAIKEGVEGNNKLQIIKSLVEHEKTLLGQVDNEGMTALMHAVIEMNTEAIQMLIEKLPENCRLSDEWLSRRDNGMNEDKAKTYRDILTAVKEGRKIVFRGLVRGATVLRKRRLNAAHVVYAPGGAGFKKALESFSQSANLWSKTTNGANNVGECNKKRSSSDEETQNIKKPKKF